MGFWGSLVSTVVTIGVDAGIGIATGGTGLLLAPEIGAAAGALAGGLTDHFADNESWGDSMKSSALDGLIGAATGGVGAKVLGGLASKLPFVKNGVQDFLKGNVFASAKTSTSKLSRYLHSGNAFRDIGSGAGEGIANWSTDKGSTAAATLPYVDIGNGTVQYQNG